MKQLVYLMLAMILLSSCNKQELRSLRLENANLKSKVVKLNNQLGYLEQEYQEYQECKEKIYDLEFDLSQKVLHLNVCKDNYEGYRYGTMCSTTRFVRGRGQVTVYGAANVIAFLSDHYTP